MPTNQSTTVIDSREERGLKIAAMTKLRKDGGSWIVPSQSSTCDYVVDPLKGTCTCPDFQNRGVRCKHQIAVSYTIERETRTDGTVKETRSLRVTYSQEWTAYNSAQVNEERLFKKLLSSLCEGIPQPTQTNGRPRLALSDVVMTLGLKVYGTMSGRRSMSTINDAEDAGLVQKAPHYNSAFRYLESAELTPLLRSLIEESALPLKAVESDFAVDSSGFGVNRLRHWYDEKYHKMRQEREWVKAHLMCGVRTHIVTSVDVTPTHAADAPFLPALVNATANSFAIEEVSADKAYSSKRNLRAIANVGAVPYIPFKQGTKGLTRVKAEQDALWQRLWGFYTFNQTTFYEHYHKRSNVETVFSMIKMKFGDVLRSRTATAQVNEVLVKVLCHNICVLIQSIFELDLEPTFWQEAVAPKVSELPQNSPLMGYF